MIIKTSGIIIHTPSIVNCSALKEHCNNLEVLRQQLKLTTVGEVAQQRDLTMQSSSEMTKIFMKAKEEGILFDKGEIGKIALAGSKGQNLLEMLDK